AGAVVGSEGGVCAGAVGAGEGAGVAAPAGSSARSVALISGITSAATIRIPRRIIGRESQRVNNMVLASKVSIRKTLRSDLSRSADGRSGDTECQEIPGYGTCRRSASVRLFQTGL